MGVLKGITTRTPRSLAMKLHSRYNSISPYILNGKRNYDIETVGSETTCNGRRKEVLDGKLGGNGWYMMKVNRMDCDEKTMFMIENRDLLGVPLDKIEKGEVYQLGKIVEDGVS